MTFASKYGRQTDIYNGVDFNFSARLPRGALLSGGVNIGNLFADGVNFANLCPATVPVPVTQGTSPSPGHSGHPARDFFGVGGLS